MVLLVLTQHLLQGWMVFEREAQNYYVQEMAVGQEFVRMLTFELMTYEHVNISSSKVFLSTLLHCTLHQYSLDTVGNALNSLFSY